MGQMMLGMFKKKQFPFCPEAVSSDDSLRHLPVSKQKKPIDMRNCRYRPLTFRYQTCCVPFSFTPCAVSRWVFIKLEAYGP